MFYHLPFKSQKSRLQLTPLGSQEFPIFSLDVFFDPLSVMTPDLQLREVPAG